MLNIVIGGSAGSFPIVTNILAKLDKSFSYPMFLCLHRLKSVRTGFVEALRLKSSVPVFEPHDREPVINNTISLSTEGVVNHSRPSIDITFGSAAKSFGSKCVGILLSGANKDGAIGLKAMKDSGATIIVQSPQEAQVKTMPMAALKITEPDFVFTSSQIISYLQKNYK